METIEKAIRLWKENKGKEGWLNIIYPNDYSDPIDIYEDTTEEEILKAVSKILVENSRFDADEFEVIFEED